MKKWFLSSFSVLLLAISMNSTAQSPCASLSLNITSGTLNQPCDTTAVVNLTVEADINTNFAVLETNTYTVDTIPFSPYPWVGGNTFTVTSDDTWSPVYPIPFKFCFFGQSYSEFVIGSNGQISFDTSRATLYNNWATNGQIAPLNDPDMNNTIMGCYHDILYTSTNGATCTWDTIGIAPCRKLIINWIAPMYSCTGMLDSQQIVLHEFTNIIDVNLGSKPLCATWNGGVAHQGIQNSTGTTAFMAPGRNGTIWGPVNNDSRQFAPAGSPYVFQEDYFWYNGQTNALISTGKNFTMSSPYPPYVICKARLIGGCNNDTTFAQDTLFFLPGKVAADFEPDIRLGCVNDTVIFNNTTVPNSSQGATFFWNFGDGNFSSLENPTHVYGVQNVYTVTLIVSHPDCIGDTIIKTFDLRHPITPVFDITPDSVCLGAPVIISNSSLGSLPIPMPNLFVNTWDMGDGTTMVNNSAQFPYTYAMPGSYTVKLVITDSLGCQDSISHDVFVEDSSFVSLTASPTEVCLGNFVQFTDEYASHTVTRIYDFDDGTVLSNIHNPRHTYEQPGSYNVTFVGQYLICPDESASVTIQVNDYPLLNLGPDTSYCPGLTNPITLSNIENPSQILQWSDGSSGPTLEVNDFGKFWATTSNLNCVSSDSVWVKRDCYLNIPNSFSPNADGRNDYFLPRQLLAQGLKEFSMKIFNRWGELIYETNSIEGRGWDGRFGDKEQSVGVYIYQIDAQWSNNYRNSFRGNVTLLR